MALGEIDPSLIEWHSRRYERGRATPIRIAFPSGRAARVEATFRATPTDALAAMAQLENCAHPSHIAAAPLFVILHAIAGQRPNGKRAYARQIGGVKISTTPIGAQALLDDLKCFTSRTNPGPIRSSTVAMVLDALANARMSRYRATRESIDALLELDGPWISAFAKRLRDKHVSSDDHSLLKKILAAAEDAGYKRAEFFRRDRPNALLLWPIQAFLIEYCLGGAHWWIQQRLIPPMRLVRQNLKRNRGSSEKRTIYKRYLRKGWREIIYREPEPDYLPRRLRHLL